MGLLDDLQGHYNAPSHTVIARDVTQVLSALVAYVEGGNKLPDPPENPGAPESAQGVVLEEGKSAADLASENRDLLARVKELESQSASQGDSEQKFSPPTSQETSE